MEENIEANSKPSDPVTPATLESVPLSPAEERARRWLIGGLVVAALFLIGLIALLTILSVDAYRAAAGGQGPTPGEIVVSLLRDAAIIFVAFETLFMKCLGHCEVFLDENGVNVELDKLVSEYNATTIDTILTTKTSKLTNSNKLIITKHDLGSIQLTSIEALESTNSRVREAKKLEKLKKLQKAYPYLCRFPEELLN